LGESQPAMYFNQCTFPTLRLSLSLSLSQAKLINKEYNIWQSKNISPFYSLNKLKSRHASYYRAEGGVLELLETGAPYAPHVKAKIT